MGIMLFVGGYASISFFNIIYMHIKEKEFYFNFDKKLKDKGYEKTNNDSSLFSRIADEVVDRGEYAARIVLSLFPIANLYPFIQIITKKLDKEYNTILNSLDNGNLLDSLEEGRYIYNQNTILRGKENIVSKIDEMSKSNEPNNKHIEISESDSLEQLKCKKALLDEMIYLRNLEEMAQIVPCEEYEEAKERTEKVKQLRFIKTFNKNQKIDE